MGKLLLSLPDKDIERIETLIDAGEYATKSEFIRFAIKQLLYSESRVQTLQAGITRLQKQTKSKRQIESEIEESKSETRRILSAKAP